ncbi:Chromatin modification-related protein EAF3 [Rhynchospora pubera]|uniref:Chromatin modification-related protein EAF3 n=1 Tax=Rhynchospora pubera TaxID=906938 RepID=A0AAV8D3J2_9POAL|nr:Chromatin modification-related protein EAF3 [Rhynchospora pubera]
MGSSNPSDGAVPKEEEEDEEMANGDAAEAEADGGPSDGSGSPDSSTPPPFSEGEKVLAFHGPLIYEAKIQKAEVLEGKWKFFVHYLGWNKNWDEWVAVDRLLKHTKENVAKQEELAKESQLQEKSKSRSSQKPSKTDVKPEKEDAKNQGSKGKKRKSVPPSEEKEKEKKPQESPLMLQFPLTLKKQLVDDAEFVTQLGKLVKLPRSPNVDDILKKYLEHRTKKDGMINESVSEILKGLRCYFDKALPVLLLYNKEKAQYNDMVKEDVSPSTIYGAEHLLRLFVKLPELLSHVSMEEEALTKLQQRLLDFLKFMQKNQSLFFLSSYDTLKGAVKSE